MTDNVPPQSKDEIFQAMRPDLYLPGMEIAEITGTHLVATAEVDERQHQPWGIVHGGVWATLVESAASVGAAYAVYDQGLVTVGVHNSTNFLRPLKKGKVTVDAQALHQGKTQQLWEVVITSQDNGKVVARGQLRLQNIPAER